jgi:hypothetical protein
MTTFHHRLAALADLPELEASFEIMGVDTRLIEDGTYFVIEEAGRILGCGGWSPRACVRCIPIPMSGGAASDGECYRYAKPQLRERVFARSSWSPRSPVSRSTRLAGIW